ncbi:MULTISPECIES: carbohydrate ABC transporter permease [unclassified Brachybacterium]|uniref:carbohydrate ABC transporter permease n=1 Tax=unclassified Brachybacterium TaxID=2623841 RepID=UPI004034C941
MSTATNHTRGPRTGGKAALPGQNTPARRAHRRKLLAGASLRHVLLAVGAVVMLYPVLWMLAASFKPTNEIFSSPSLIPSVPTLGNYVEGWFGVEINFDVYLINSLIVCTAAVIGNVVTCSMAAYAFSRLDFRFRPLLFAIMLVTIMLPYHAVLIPQYTLFNSLGWIDTYLPLIVPKLLATDGFFTFLMVQFIRGIPRELDEAAEIDGAGPIRRYFSVILPLMTPALVTTAIFTFVWTYDDLFSQMIYLSDRWLYTVPVGLRSFLDATGQSNWGGLMAMSIVSLIPVVLLFFLFQKRLVEGVGAGSLKG